MEILNCVFKGPTFEFDDNLKTDKVDIKAEFNEGYNAWTVAVIQVQKNPFDDPHIWSTDGITEQEAITIFNELSGFISKHGFLDEDFMSHQGLYYC